MVAELGGGGRPGMPMLSRIENTSGGNVPSTEAEFLIVSAMGLLVSFMVSSVDKVYVIMSS